MRPRWQAWAIILLLPIIVPAAIIIAGVQEVVPTTYRELTNKRTWAYLFGGTYR